MLVRFFYRSYELQYDGDSEKQGRDPDSSDAELHAHPGKARLPFGLFGLLLLFCPQPLETTSSLFRLVEGRQGEDVLHPEAMTQSTDHDAGDPADAKIIAASRIVQGQLFSISKNGKNIEAKLYSLLEI